MAEQSWFCCSCYILNNAAFANWFIISITTLPMLETATYHSPEEKGTTEDEMVGWHHQLNGHGFRWTLCIGDGQRGLAYWSSWGHKESDMTEQLNELN